MIYTLPDIIQQSAQSYPNKVAFVSGVHMRTYAQMSDEINQLANVLEAQGVQKGDRVGIYLNRSIETAVAIFGIMKAGAIYVPLDTSSPTSLTLYLIKECDIHILISNPSQRRKLSALTSVKSTIDTIIGWKGEQSVDVITWDTVRSASKHFTSSTPLLEHDPAYIIYTSGSTGNPKGIVHTHHRGLAYARLSVDTFGIHKEDRIANHAPVFFDISLLGYFAGPIVGATTIIIPDAATIMPFSLAALIEKEKITIWYSVPLALIQMLQSGSLPSLDVSPLRWVMYAGEPFPPKYLRELMQLWPNIRFCNKYGPAETNVCTYHILTETPSSDEPISIGVTWANTEKLIVDLNNNEVTQGESGELLIRSATAMLGYWQDSAKTNESFYSCSGNHGFVKDYYRTGDLVREDKEGRLHFLGRKDHQIKTRGYRVELGAIEAILIAHDEVVEAVVYAVKHSDDTVSISGAVIMKSEYGANEEDLISYLSDKLPHYAVPTEIRLMEEFPRTGSGKTNRPALIDQLNKHK